MVVEQVIGTLLSTVISWRRSEVVKKLWWIWGFNISDLLAYKHAELAIPPGRRGALQMPKTDVMKTKEIANRRIRVEQVIRRIKSFNMLKYEVPITLLHSLDDIFIICSAICNLLPPISKK